MEIELFMLSAVLFLRVRLLLCPTWVTSPEIQIEINCPGVWKKKKQITRQHRWLLKHKHKTHTDTHT